MSLVDEDRSGALPLGKKLSFFTPDSEYHGGLGQGYGARHFSGGASKERGQSYAGYWKDDEQEGKGQLTTHEGTKYDGEWSKGAFNVPAVPELGAHGAAAVDVHRPVAGLAQARQGQARAGERQLVRRPVEDE